MIGTTHGLRRTDAGEQGLPYRFVGPARFAAWGQTADAVVPFARGTEGDDTFTGTDVDERYLGLGGDDTLTGGGGIDRLYGDDGNDRLDGGEGDDFLYGGLGDDVVSGGTGDDTIWGDSGKDRLSGGDGDDVINADIGRSRLYGGAGNDVLAGNDCELLGGAGYDDLSGSNCAMQGGAGNDDFHIYDPFRKSDDRVGAWGGSGTDDFIFAGLGRLGGGTYIIHDLSNDERIDLSGLDANERVTGDQEFRLVPEFDGHAREMTIRYDAAEDITLIELYTNNDRMPEGTIIVPGNHADFTNFVF